MQIKDPIPDSPRAWFEEIAEAYKDASETIPFGGLLGQDIKPEDLFHVAPIVCLKFRGLGLTGKLQQQATEAALSSYVATEDQSPDALSAPQLAFALAYVASHFGLGLLDRETANALMEYIEEHQDELVTLAR